MGFSVLALMITHRVGISGEQQTLFQSLHSLGADKTNALYREIGHDLAGVTGASATQRLEEAMARAGIVQSALGAAEKAALVAQARAMTRAEIVSTLTARQAPYRVADPSRVVRIDREIRRLYDDFHASGGRIVWTPNEPVLVEGIEVAGYIHRMDKVIYLGRYSNLGTLAEELLHFEQLKTFSLWGQGVLQPQVRDAMESEVRILLRHLGFVRS
jgi:hypothetical protein